MPKTVYTSRQKAAALAELTANKGNIKRTARNLGIHHDTIRKWKREWDTNGVPEEIQNEVIPVIGNFLEDAVRVRHKLLIFIEHSVDANKIQVNQATQALAALSDRIRAYEQVTTVQQVEHNFNLPEPEKLKELLSGLLTGVVEAARQRAGEIEAVEEPALTTFKELPAVEETNE